LLEANLHSHKQDLKIAARAAFFVALGGILNNSGLCPQSPRVFSC
jgi:hypothetical protein